MGRLILFISLLLSTSSGAYSATILDQDITVNTYLDASSGPYELSKDIRISQGVKLKIAPGVVFQSNSNFKLIVNGSLITEGTEDSVIQFNLVNLEFRNTAIGYDFEQDTGTKISYCLFNGNESGGIITIKSIQIPLLIENCKFFNCYYTLHGIDANFIRTKVALRYCIFDSDKAGGYPVFVNGSKTELELSECYMHHQNSLSLPSMTYIKNCTFDDFAATVAMRINQTSAGGVFEMYCSELSNTQTSLEFSQISSLFKIKLINNTFRESKSFIQISPGSISEFAKLYIYRNNFLNSSSQAVKVAVVSNPGTILDLDFGSNYWNTTDSLLIENRITDHSDLSNIPYKIRFTDFLSSEVESCDSDPTHVQEIELYEFAVYPNPSSGEYCLLRFKEPALRFVQVMGMDGKRINQYQFEGTNYYLSLKDLRAGLYYLKVWDADKHQVGVRVLHLIR